MLDVSDVLANYRKQGWWRDQTFLDDLRRHCAATPGKPALIGHQIHGAEPRTTVTDYAELTRLTDAFAARLVALGVRPGDVVAVQLPNCWELLPLGLACARAGAVFCPLMTVYRRRELEYILRLTGARVCITISEWGGVRLADIVTALAADLPEIEHVVVAGQDRPAGTLSFADYFLGAPSADADELDGLALGPDDPFLVLFTSGTTGESKGVLHSQNTLYASCRAYSDILKLDDGIVAFVAHATTHYSGFVVGMLVPLLLGGTAMVQDVWDAPAYLDAAARHKVTTFYGAPNFLVDLLAVQRDEPRDVSTLTSIVTGSAPIPPHLVEQVAAVYGVRVIALWGMTENGAVTITRLDDPPDWAQHSDGSPIPGMQVRIDTSTVRGRSDGSGRLLVRGSSQCLGYFKRDEVYAKALDGDGWFDTGDLARDDGRGGIRLTGRVKDVVTHRGFNVPVGEVENALALHPQVAEVAIIGLPDDRADEVVCAVVVPAGSPPSLDSLREHLADAGFNEWFWPGRLEVLDVLPRTITGKVRKVDLRQRFGAG